MTTIHDQLIEARAILNSLFLAPTTEDYVQRLREHAAMHCPNAKCPVTRAKALLKMPVPKEGMPKEVIERVMFLQDADFNGLLVRPGALAEMQYADKVFYQGVPVKNRNGEASDLHEVRKQFLTTQSPPASPSSAELEAQESKSGSHSPESAHPAALADIAASGGQTGRIFGRRASANAKHAAMLKDAKKAAASSKAFAHELATTPAAPPSAPPPAIPGPGADETQTA